MKIAIIVGTRPEIIKMSPIINYCKKIDVKYDVIHTQQHYSINMDKVFFENLRIDYPKINLCIKSKPAHLQISEIISKCGDIFLANGYDIILVQGDTNTVLGSAIAAQKCGIKLGHVEAGLRSFDRSMPEEINRIITDSLSNYCFCPTNVSRQNLINEGIENERLFVVGNTIVDALHQNLINIRDIDIKKKLHLSDKYALVTMHRPANVDNPNTLSKIIKILDEVEKRFDIQIVFSVHPRTHKHIKNANIQTNNIFMLDPLGYFDFLSLIINASLIITDSGGIQEEACILKKPCITLRENTERPETLKVHANILTGLDKNKILDAIDYWLKTKEFNWGNPFGNGDTSEQIINILLENL